MVFPPCEQPCFTPIQNNRQNNGVPFILICIFLDSKLEDKRFCTKLKHTFPDYNLLLISSRIEFWSSKVVPKYFGCFTFSKELLSIVILRLRLEFWSRDTVMYLVLSAFHSGPISLLATTTASVFLYSMYTSVQHINIISINQSSCVPFNFMPSWFMWTLLMAYSKAKVKSNGNKASPCFKPFLIGNMSDTCLPTWTLQ